MSKPIGCIREILQLTSFEKLPSVLEELRDDSRAGVQKLILSYDKKIADAEKERKRLKELNLFENALHDKGLCYIAGIDEVGRGPLAGPVLACAVIFPKGTEILFINDSKKLTEDKRNQLYSEIMEKAISVGIGAVNNDVIDDINILKATHQAMRVAISNLSCTPDSILVDGLEIPVKIPQRAIVQGDSKSISIAAASIIAKVTRDNIMYKYNEEYPQYGFDRHKGYGSKEHLDAIRQHGLSPIHRKSFCKNIYVGKNG